MTAIEYEGKTAEIDSEGYLVDTEVWNEDIAYGLARHEGFDEFTDEQLEIVRFMRNYYKKFNAFPILNYVCKNINLPRKCVSEEFINPEKAWKIAGLPKQDGIHFVSVDGKQFLMEECC